MLRRFGVNYAIFSLAMDASVVLAALVLAERCRPDLLWLPFSHKISSDMHLPTFVYVATPVLWVVALSLLSLYNPKAIFKVTDELRILLVGSGLAGLAAAGLLYLSYREVSRWLFVVFVVLAFALLCVWRTLARLATVWAGKPPMATRRVLVVGAGEMGRVVGQLIEQYEWAGLRLVGYLDDEAAAELNGLLLGRVADVREVALAQRVDEVVLALPYGDRRLEQVVKALLDIPLHVRSVPGSSVLALDRPAVDDFAGIPLVDLRAGPLSDYQRVVKRIFDLVVGGALLVLTLPIMAAVALAIKLDSPGPALFRQARVGENGRLFTIYKFRSMVQDAERLQPQVTVRDADGNLVHKRQGDPRVTRVGRFIRRTSLDELPQLFNVLKGEMSLVGPRPELPWLVERYEPWQRRRLVVPPGLTGWWQVNGRSDKLMHLHTDEDIYYIANYSFWLDLRILWRTLWVVLQGKGAH